MRQPKKQYYCDHCKKEFWAYASQKETRGYKYHFCTRACKYEWNKTQPGYFKGRTHSLETRKLISQKTNNHGKNNPNWKGGKRIDKDGYVLIWKPDHPHADYHGYVREHRLVMEKIIGRVLLPSEVVHHIDHDKKNNKPKNLTLINSWSEHQKLHYYKGDSKHLKNYKVSA